MGRQDARKEARKERAGPTSRPVGSPPPRRIDSCMDSPADPCGRDGRFGPWSHGPTGRLDGLAAPWTRDPEGGSGTRRTDGRTDGRTDRPTRPRIHGSTGPRGSVDPRRRIPGRLGRSWAIQCWFTLSLSHPVIQCWFTLSLSLSLTQQFNAGSLSLSYSVIQCWFTFSLLLNNSMLVHFPSLTQ